MKSHVFNIECFYILFKEWSSKNVVLDVSDSKGKDKSVRSVVNIDMKREVDIEENWNLGFVCNCYGFGGRRLNFSISEDSVSGRLRTAIGAPLSKRKRISNLDGAEVS